MADNAFKKIIGSEIRRVQDEVRRGVGTLREEVSVTIDESTDSVRESLANEYRSGRRHFSQVMRNELGDDIELISGDSEAASEVFEDISTTEDLEAIEETEAIPMGFPLFVFGAAVVVDLLDIFAVPVPFGMTVVNLFFSIFLFFWFKGKIKESFVESSQNIARSRSRLRRTRRLARTKVGKNISAKFKKKFQEKFARKFAGKMLTRRFFAYAITSLVWILQIIVLQSLFVLVVWKQQSKMVQGYMRMIEKISNILDRIDSAEDQIFNSFTQEASDSAEIEDMSDGEQS